MSIKSSTASSLQRLLLNMEKVCSSFICKNRRLSIPVKQIAISKETGEELRLCNVCKGYFEPSNKTCPYCGGLQPEEEKEEPVECPSCGNEVSLDMIFCNKCGSNLRKIRAKRVSNRDKLPKKVECPKCGKMLRREMKLCNACGTPLDPNEPSGRGKKSKAGRNSPSTELSTDPEPTVYENVECYQCGGMIPVTTKERPTIVTCSVCGTQGQLQ